MTKLKRFSVLLNWSGDPDDGDYGWSGKARDAADAERRARLDMRDNYIGAHCDGMTRKETKEMCAEYEDMNGEFGGSIIEVIPGAAHKAQKLEDALAALTRAVSNKRGVAKALAAAKATLASLDAA